MKIHKLKVVVYLCIIALCFSCRKQSGSQVIIYNNDFETGDIKNITNGITEVYNGSRVLGRFNNKSFTLNLSSLPQHHLLKVTFDLYIHDNWAGNASYLDNYFGPDMWEMDIDSSVYVNTTFSNLGCAIGNICPPQSFPLSYQATNNPRTGAYNTQLPGACALKNNPSGTSLYKIEKTINHSSNTMVLKCFDQLRDKSTTDVLCNKSWSVDNIQVTLIP